MAAAPAGYTPRHISEQILAVRSAIEGERKQVSVLFCGIVASSALAAELGPEEFHLVIDRFFRVALAEVHRYQGTVNQFLGDGFMALFGAPIAHEDHARRAVLAALQIWEGLPVRYIFDWMARWPLAAVALASGKVEEAVAHVRGMLPPPQQLLLEPARTMVEDAVRAWDAGQADEAEDLLHRAVRAAGDLGYL